MAKGKTVKAGNKRVTENLVREELRKLGYNDTDNNTVITEQKSDIEAVRKALASASKTGAGGKGAPEFIVSDPDNPDFLMVVECTASVADHASAALPALLAGGAIEEDATDYAKRVVRFAADGALHYARALSKDFSVIAIAVSGQTKPSMKVSTYLHARGSASPKIFVAKNGAAIDSIISWPDYVENAAYDPSVQAVRLSDLVAFSRELHDFMRDHAKLTESEKPLLVSGTLIALQNKPFSLSYDAHKPEDLQRAWISVIEDEINKAKLPQAKKTSMSQPYSGISVHPELSKSTVSYPKGVLNELIRRLDEKVRPFIGVYHDFDVVGQFYGEFLKYTGGDKKALGIVLTPRHITETFALLANVNKYSKVLDICAGTGGFLISAMHQMMKSAITELDRENIKKSGLIGVEQLPNMFALAASNMILRGDGKANLYQGSCFDDGIVDAIKKYKCNVGMVNPPYSQGDASLHELVFVKQMLDCLTKGGIGIAIVPMNCAIAPHSAKEEIIKHHTLEAVMSMPDELFAPVGTITCIMVFTAKVPHAVSNKKSWFGYWKKDGFLRAKHRGRIDPNMSWPPIRDRWVETFRNREVVAGESVLQMVGARDEWCAEAYMETDYSTLRREDFESELKKYVAFRILNVEGTMSDEDETA